LIPQNKYAESSPEEYNISIRTAKFDHNNHPEDQSPQTSFQSVEDYNDVEEKYDSSISPQVMAYCSKTRI
jgi:hypothetical protein